MSRRTCALAVVVSLLVSTTFATEAVAASGPAVCAAYASEAGFAGDALVEAIAVGMAESDCRPDATHRNPDGQLDQGIFMIGQADGSRNACYLNPACNSQVAFSKYTNQGRSWLPAWQASYHNQKYRDSLPAARQAAAPYLEPNIGRIGVLASGGLLVKEGATNAFWGDWQMWGVAKFELDGDRIGVLTTSGQVWVKEGGLQAGWGALQEANVKDFHLAGNRIGVLRNDGTLAVKEGGTDAPWTEQTNGVTDFDLTPNRIGVVSADGQAWAKEGALNSDWVHQRGGARDIELAGNRLGVLTWTSELVVKDGTLWAGWDNQTHDVVDFDLTPSRIGVVLSGGLATVKDGQTNAHWVDQMPHATSIDLSGNRIGVLEDSGKYWVKEGTLWADWGSAQYGGVSQGDLAHRR